MCIVRIVLMQARNIGLWHVRSLTPNRKEKKKINRIQWFKWKRWKKKQQESKRENRKDSPLTDLKAVTRVSMGTAQTRPNKLTNGQSVIVDGIFYRIVITFYTFHRHPIHWNYSTLSGWNLETWRKIVKKETNKKVENNVHTWWR